MRKLATCLFSLAAAIFAAVYILPESAVLPAAVVLAVSGAAALLLKGDVRLRACLIIFGASAGMFVMFFANLIVYEPAARLDGAEGVFKAEAVAFSVPTERGARVDADILADGKRIRSRIYINGDIEELRPGDVLEIKGDAELSDEMFGEDTDIFFAKGCMLFVYADETEVTERKGVTFLNAPKYMARSLTEKTAEIFPDKLEPFMLALLTGSYDRLYDDTGLTDALNVAGVRHIVVVSGMHLSYIMSVVWLLFGRRRRVAIASIPLIFLFMAVTGFTPSVVRAGVMQIMMLIAPVFEREDDSITSLSAALALLLIINPYSAASLGLQLTFAATLGIVLFAERIYESVDGALEKTRAYRKKPAKRAIKAIIANLSTTIGASIFTIPIVAVRLNYMSVAAPLTNLLVAWAVSAVFILGLAALILGFIFVPVGTAAAFIAGLPARYVIWVVRTIASGRFASVYTVNRLVVFWMIYAAVVFLLFYIYRKELIRVVPAACLVSISLCAILLFTYIRYENREMTVTVLDVGQGQSIVVTSGSATAVIDCGSSSGEEAGALAAQYLRSIGRKNAEIFILTHYHADHANGADEFMELIDVDTLLAPDESISDSYLAEDMLMLAEEQEVDVIYVENRMTVALGDAVIELYPPLGDDDENELGIVAVCTAGDYDVLVTGDIPSSIERRLVHDYRLPDTEVFIAGHHGSKYSNSYDLLNAVKPETVIISVGNNTYGHPTDEALERFAAVGAEVYRTDFSGNITIDTGDKNGRKKAG